MVAGTVQKYFAFKDNKKAGIIWYAVSMQCQAYSTLFWLHSVILPSVKTINFLRYFPILINIVKSYLRKLSNYYVITSRMQLSHLPIAARKNTPDTTAFLKWKLMLEEMRDDENGFADTAYFH